MESSSIHMTVLTEFQTPCLILKSLIFFFKSCKNISAHDFRLLLTSFTSKLICYVKSIWRFHHFHRFLKENGVFFILDSKGTKWSVDSWTTRFYKNSKGLEISAWKKGTKNLGIVVLWSVVECSSVDSFFIKSYLWKTIFMLKGKISYFDTFSTNNYLIRG